MEKERGYKVVAIVALLIAVVGVGIGFAAFSATFTIEEAPVTVNPSENLLANNMKYVSTSKFDPENIVTSVGNFKDNNTWGGISLSINEKNNTDTVVQAEIKNESNYDVYLTKIYSTTNGSNTSSGRVECIAEEDTNQELVNKFCQRNGEYFDVYVVCAHADVVKEFALSDEPDSSIIVASAQLMEAANLDITEEVKIPVGESLYVALYFVPNYSNRTSLTFPDGPFKVYVPEIKVEFSTTAPTTSNN